MPMTAQGQNRDLPIPALVLQSCRCGKLKGQRSSDLVRKFSWAPPNNLLWPTLTGGFLKRGRSKCERFNRVEAAQLSERSERRTDRLFVR
ncbi:hypothetical protein FQA47_024561 [Oryzias melastigma]|uniref:Uncharacterized protein n=1 Tax=Oryzias melastigma TaxID=30732 RepID=A0A834KZI2_ORYME|nr:hypothetical protein FQA47_024561 [Oryzias melastigma]